jgi:hypothetical protein
MMIISMPFLEDLASLDEKHLRRHILKTESAMLVSRYAVAAL